MRTGIDPQIRPSPIHTEIKYFLDLEPKHQRVNNTAFVLNLSILPGYWTAQDHQTMMNEIEESGSKFLDITELANNYDLGAICDLLLETFGTPPTSRN